MLRPPTSEGIHVHLPETGGPAPAVPPATETLTRRALEQVSDLTVRTYAPLPPVGHKRELDAALLREAATNAGLDVVALSADTSLLRDGDRQLVVHKNMPASLLAIDRGVTNHKHLTKQVLAAAGVPVAAGQLVHDTAQAEAVLRGAEVPLVAKPIVGSGGRGVSVGIETQEDLHSAIAPIIGAGRPILLEEAVPGIDLRVMTVAGRAVAVSLRVPANVIGDGHSTIEDLLGAKNQHRWTNPYLRLNPIVVTDGVRRHLSAQGLSTSSVLAAGERVFLHLTANISAGGDSYEITDRIHPDLLHLAEDATSCFPSTHHAGIDLIVERLEAPLTSQRAIVCEVNLNNDLPLHVFPLYGQPTPVHEVVIAAYRDHFHAIPAPQGPASSEVTAAELQDLTRGTPTLAPRDVLGDANASRRGVDNHHLRHALEAAGQRQVSFRGNLIFAASGHTQRVYHRSARSVIARPLSGHFQALHQLAGELGVPVLDAAENLDVQSDEPIVRHSSPVCRILLIDGTPVASMLEPGPAGAVGNHPVTVGLEPEPFPGLGEAATVLYAGLGGRGVLAISFGLRQVAEDRYIWALQGVEADPVLASFAFPDVGTGTDVYAAVVQTILASSGYALTGKVRPLLRP